MLRFLRSLRRAIAEKDQETLKVLVHQVPPQELGLLLKKLPSTAWPLIFSSLPVEKSVEIFRNFTEGERQEVFHQVGAQALAPVVLALPPDEQVDFLQALQEPAKKELVAYLPQRTVEEILSLSSYGKETAGGIMSPQVVSVQEDVSCEEAIEEIRKKASADAVFYVYTTNRAGELTGVLELRKLLTYPPQKKVKEIVKRDVIFVEPELDQEEVAQIFQRYDLLALPVVSQERKLLGVITADDVMEVIQQEMEEDIFKMVGSEAEELEKKNPFAIARMRLPWLLITLAVETIAGSVVYAFNETLSRVILLASFMPIISALSGNVGLQAAAITIRALATGHLTVNDWKRAVRREFLVDLAIALAIGLLLGLLAAFWGKNLKFGTVVAIAMVTAIMTAGFMGTLFPLLTKKAGFDPAAAAGPFETAFQDTVGFAVFLGLATLLLHWME